MSQQPTSTPATLIALLGPSEPELSCQDCFEQLDRYVELEAGGQEAERALPRMRPHLKGCPACREDHDSLLALVMSDLSRPPKLNQQ